MLSVTGCKGRIARLAAALNPGLDGVVITRPEQLLYFANFFAAPNSLNLHSASFLFIRRDGTTTLFTDNWLGPVAGTAADEIIVVDWYTMQSPARLRQQAVASNVAAHLRSLGARAIGGELSALPSLIGRAVADVVDLEPLLQSLREVKDPDEIDAMRLAMKTAEAIHAFSRVLLQPGFREIDFYAMLLDRATRAAERPFVMMCDLVSGERALQCGGPPTTRRMREGELVILDIFPYVDGYRADITNTLCVGGRPSAAQSDAFASVEAALAAGTALLRPGVPVQEVFEAMEREILKSSYGSPLPGHGGHGLGLGHPESPHVVRSSDRTLASGMVIALEPGIYHPAVGGIRIENNYLVGPNGAERLSNHRLAL